MNQQDRGKKIKIERTASCCPEFTIGPGERLFPIVRYVMSRDIVATVVVSLPLVTWIV